MYCFRDIYKLDPRDGKSQSVAQASCKDTPTMKAAALLLSILALAKAAPKLSTPADEYPGLTIYRTYADYVAKRPVPYTSSDMTDEHIPEGITANFIGKKTTIKKDLLRNSNFMIAYMKSFFGEENLCSVSAVAYMEVILSGRSVTEAYTAAEKAYKAAWESGMRSVPGTNCAASEYVFKETYDSKGKDSILEAAGAFVNNSPGVRNGNPCAVSGKAFMDAVYKGESIDDAGVISAKTFIRAFGDLAKSGKSLDDSFCADAAKAYMASSSNTFDSASKDSAAAFIDATLTKSNSVYDPACAASALAYIDAFASGINPETSSAIAAKVFFQEIGKSSAPGASSPCVKATLERASPARWGGGSKNDAMMAFVQRAVNDGPEFFNDPVCGAATLAYLDAKIDQESDEVAGKAAAEAYVQAYVDNGGKRSEACKKSISTLIKIQGVLSNSVEL